MKSYPFLTISSAILGFLTIIGLFFSWLAIIDIKQGLEPDLTTEWTVVFLSRLVTFLFAVFALLTIIALKLKIKNLSDKS